MLRLRMKMHSGAYASSRQDTDNVGPGVVRSSWGRSFTRGSAILNSVCIQADFSHCLTCWALRAVEGSYHNYNDV
jgi:hypothetical protein